ncbi:MAG: hypothetical protein FWC45_01060, partial [Treponema sp.]|nr:hypothetical protein [Treponema sp.]
NMARPGGEYINDTNSTWNGITVFASIQLGEALLYHGKILDAVTKEKWSARLRKAADFLLGTELHSNINYPITCAASLAVAHCVLGDDKYAVKARKLARQAITYITPEGLIFGEGKPNDVSTKKGCRAVDLGYNVEESLGGLVTYGLLMKDEEILAAAEKSMLAHLAFMLPDGAWDNSWGSRSNKWTYWGSRTSDGCQIAYGLLSARNPLFAEAAYRNALLYKRCTHKGLLHGGPMYVSAGEPPCVHHTFCHAKALAAILDHGVEVPAQHPALPREEAKGLSYYPSIHTALIAKGPWRATVTDYDYDYVVNGHATGGAITMLWHKDSGPVLASTMTEYSLVEPNNMQLPQYFGNIALTARIEKKTDGNYFRSCADQEAAMICKDGQDISVNVSGHLRDGAKQAADPFKTEYIFTEKETRIIVSVEGENCVYKLPVIASSKAVLNRIDEAAVEIQTETARILIKANQKLNIENKAGQRIFNPVGGFEAVPFYVDLTGGRKVELTLMVV